MDVLFLLIPLSVLLALAVIGVLAWAVWSGQFEALESEGERIVASGQDDSPAAFDTSLIQIKEPSALRRDT